MLPLCTHHATHSAQIREEAGYIWEWLQHRPVAPILIQKMWRGSRERVDFGVARRTFWRLAEFCAAMAIQVGSLVGLLVG